MELTFIQTIIVASLVAAASGLVGSFALLRRMALVGDALSHVALPGLALGLIFHFNVILGALVFLILGVILIWFIQHKTNLPVDTLVGVLFTLSLAVGALLSSGEELLDALFGDIGKLTQGDFWLATVLSIVIIAVVLKFSKKFTLMMISRDLAQSAGLKPHYLELIFLLIFALTVALGIKFIGALLMGALIIIPAATSWNLAKSMASYRALAIFFGIFGMGIGVYIASINNLSLGPAVVVVSSLIFAISIFFRRN